MLSYPLPKQPQDVKAKGNTVLRQASFHGGHALSEEPVLLAMQIQVRETVCP
jgi:hypothetical protein